ncbi:flap endonuclease 1, partial [Gregarina niphandrodes]
GLDKKGSDQKKKKLYELPFMYPWAEAKQLFVYPDVIPLEELKDLDFQQKELQEDDLRQFLINENQFNETRVNNAIERLKTARKLCSQTRLDSFFMKTPAVKAEQDWVKSDKKRHSTTNIQKPKKKPR